MWTLEKISFPIAWNFSINYFPCLTSINRQTLPFNVPNFYFFILTVNCYLHISYQFYTLKMIPVWNYQSEYKKKYSSISISRSPTRIKKYIFRFNDRRYIRLSPTYLQQCYKNWYDCQNCSTQMLQRFLSWFYMIMLYIH